MSGRKNRRGQRRRSKGNDNESDDVSEAGTIESTVSDVAVEAADINTSREPEGIAVPKSTTKKGKSPAKTDGFHFIGDEYVHHLTKGKKTLVHGLAIPCGWSWCSSHDNPTAEAAYNKLIDDIQTMVSGNFPKGVRNMVYYYSRSALHCTIATIESFKESCKETSPMSDAYTAGGSGSGSGTSDNSSATGGSSSRVCTAEERRAKIFAVWNEVLSDSLASCRIQSTGGEAPPPSPFTMEVTSIEVAQNAVLFRFTDRAGVVEKIRGCIRSCLDDPRLRAAEAELGLESGILSRNVQIPDIIHSTFLRFAENFKDSTMENIFKQKLLAITAAWTPITVQIDEFYLVHEYNPYMQMRKTDQITYAQDLVKATGSSSSGSPSKGTAKVGGSSSNNNKSTDSIKSVRSGSFDLIAAAAAPVPFVNPIIGTFSINSMLKATTAAGSMETDTAPGPSGSVESPATSNCKIQYQQAAGESYETLLTPLTPMQDSNQKAAAKGKNKNKNGKKAGGEQGPKAAKEATAAVGTASVTPSGPASADAGCSSTSDSVLNSANSNASSGGPIDESNNFLTPLTPMIEGMKSAGDTANDSTIEGNCRTIISEINDLSIGDHVTSSDSPIVGGPAASNGPTRSAHTTAASSSLPPRPPQCNRTMFQSPEWASPELAAVCVDADICGDLSPVRPLQGGAIEEEGEDEGEGEGGPKTSAVTFTSAMVSAANASASATATAYEEGKELAEGAETTTPESMSHIHKRGRSVGHELQSEESHVVKKSHDDCNLELSESSDNFPVPAALKAATVSASATAFSARDAGLETDKAPTTSAVSKPKNASDDSNSQPSSISSAAIMTSVVAVVGSIAAVAYILYRNSKRQ